MPDVLIDQSWSAGSCTTPHLILPDGCLDVIDEGGELFVVGPMSTARWVEVSGPSQGIRFHPGATHSWLGVDIGELRDVVVPLADLLVDASWRSVEQRPLDQLASHARHRLRRDRRVVQVCRRLIAEPHLRIDDLAADVGCTARHLRRRFECEVGMSPRRFARVVRLQRVVASPSASLGDLAFRCGFTDQAHLSREIKALTGLTPTALRRVLDGVC